MALTTFLVEDNPTIRSHLIPTLEDMTQARVVACVDTEAAAVDWLVGQDGRWDLAIVDLYLKEGTGLGVLAGCRVRQPHQRVVVLTNYATPEIRRQSIALGADAVFDKSTEIDDLLEYCQPKGAQGDGGAALPS